MADFQTPFFPTAQFGEAVE